MIILDHEQGTPEWFAARMGKPSASCFSKLITTGGKPSTSASGYIDELIAECLTGESEPFYVNEHMIRGTELEPEAREAYEYISGYTVDECGFILDDSEAFGCSPDGIIEGSLPFIDEDFMWGLEIKCPAAKTQVKYLRDPQTLVKAYYQQIMGCLLVVQDADWWDVFSYHPNMGHVLVRVERDEDYLKLMAVEIKAATDAIKNQVERLR